MRSGHREERGASMQDWGVFFISFVTNWEGRRAPNFMCFYLNLVSCFFCFYCGTVGEGGAGPGWVLRWKSGVAPFGADYEAYEKTQLENGDAYGKGPTSCINRQTSPLNGKRRRRLSFS